jgi:hypothetical protein
MRGKSPAEAGLSHVAGGVALIARLTQVKPAPMLRDMLRGMALRPLLAILVALVLAIGPTLGALASAQATNPHAAMQMHHGDAGSNDGCCPSSDTDTNNACVAHCAAGVIDALGGFVPAGAVASAPVSAPVQLSASVAPAPDKQPPKSPAV